MGMCCGYRSPWVLSRRKNCRVDNPARLSRILPAVKPSPCEASAMLADLCALVGDYHTALLLHVPRCQVRAWKAAGKPPGPRIRGCLWLVWSAVCRPGQVRTVFDIETWGRFTDSGGPQHAGKRPLRPTSKRVNTTDVVHT